jgi:hypothetical protein
LLPFCAERMEIIEANNDVLEEENILEMSLENCENFKSGENYVHADDESNVEICRDGTMGTCFENIHIKAFVLYTLIVIHSIRCFSLSLFLSFNISYLFQYLLSLSFSLPISWVPGAQNQMDLCIGRKLSASNRDMCRNNYQALNMTFTLTFAIIVYLPSLTQSI